MKVYVDRANDAWPGRLSALDLLGPTGLAAISGHRLLAALLTVPSFLPLLFAEADSVDAIRRVLSASGTSSLLGMVNATTAVLTGEDSARVWIALLLAYDVVFTIACLLFFELVLEAE